jgi:ectoine hydroxylase-related dioxygenase (phytanoyl-CoA dioxygenase family)
MDDAGFGVARLAPGLEPASAEVSQLLARMQARVAEGEILAAIALGHAAQREHPDPALQHYLVALRAQAFGASAHPAVALPRPAVDPFPGLNGLPEIAAAGLTPAVLSGAIYHHGALLVRGLVDPESAEALRVGIDRACDGRDRAARGAKVAETNPSYAQAPVEGAPTITREFAEKRDAVLTADSPDMFHRLMAAFESRGVIELATAFLGERPAMSVGKSTLRRVPPGRPRSWHQDGAFLGPETRSLNVWLAVSPCGEDAPGLFLVGARVGRLVGEDAEGNPSWFIGDNIVARLAAQGMPVVAPVFAPGDALLFDQLMLHTTGARPGMTKTRWAIETWLFAPSTFPMDQGPLVI